MPPLPLRASTAAAPSSAFRPITHTRAPSVVKTPAIPLPMPFVPPVTTTDLFLSDVSMGFLFYQRFDQTSRLAPPRPPTALAEHLSAVLSTEPRRRSLTFDLRRPCKMLRSIPE